MRVVGIVSWALLLLVCPAWAQQPVQADAQAVRDVFKALNAPQASEAPRLLKSSEGFLRFVGAPAGGHFAVAPAKAGTAESTARAFLSEHEKAFCVGSPDTNYVVNRVTAANAQSYIHLKQTYKGLTVYASGFVIQVDADNGVACALSDIMRDSTAFDKGLISTTPTVTSSAARAAAVAWMVSEYGGTAADYDQQVENAPVIFDPQILGASGAKRLAWVTSIVSTESAVGEKILIDAHSGNVVFHRALIHDAKVRRIQDAHSTDSLGTTIRSEGEAPTGIADADNAYTLFGDTYDFYYDKHGRDGIDNAGMTMVGVINYCEWYQCPWQNASWSNIDQVMRFGQGYASADDVVAHELTHGVTSYESNLEYYYESGAINEAFSDIWGEFVDLTNGRGTDTTAVRWLCGEDLPIGAIRSLKNPPDYDCPDSLSSPYFWTDSSDNGGVHYNSGIINKLAYLLTDGDTFNGYTVEGMGIDATAKLLYEMQTNLLSDGSGFAEFYMMLGQATANLGYTFSEKLNVQAAARAVGIIPEDALTRLDAFRAAPAFDGLGRPVIALNWVNPDSNFRQVILVRNTEYYPSTPEDGVEVYRGTDEKYLDPVVTEGTRYYYSLFVDVTSGFPVIVYADAVAGATNTSYLTEAFQTGVVPFDLAFTQILFSPTGEPLMEFGQTPSRFGNYSGYTTTVRKNVYELPVARDDANGGSYHMTMMDEDWTGINLPKPFPFFGVPQHHAYLSTNGFLSFEYVNEFSEDNFPSAASHFAVPRISFLFADLNPLAGGSIWRRSLPDRMVLTFESVPECGWQIEALPNTVQVELFYSGHIRITYQDINAHEAVCGLSDGRGTPISPALLFPGQSLTDLDTFCNFSGMSSTPAALSLQSITPPDVKTGEVVEFSALTSCAAGAGVPSLTAQWDYSAYVPFIDNGDGTGRLQWTPGLSDWGQYTARITATLGGEVAYQDVTISVGLDTPLPVASNLKLRTGNVIEDPTRDRVIGSRQALTAQYGYSHALGYQEGQTRIRWYRNGMDVGNSSPTVTASAVVPNTSWFFSVTPYTASGVAGQTRYSAVVTVVDLPEIADVVLPEDLALPTPPLAAGASVGGTHVVILGNKLSNPSSILIGGIPVQTILSQSSTRLDVLTPAHIPSKIVGGEPIAEDVVVTTSYGTGLLRNAFLYVDSGVDLSKADVNHDGYVDAVDVQLVINSVLELAKSASVDADVNRDGRVNVLDIQTVVIEALGK